VQDDDRPAALVEVPEHLVNLVTIREGAGRVPCGRRVDWREFDLDHTASSTTRLIEAGIDDKSVQPGVESIGVPKRREIAPGSNEAILDRVACELGVPEDEASRRVQPHDGHAGELREGVMIAPPCTLHEPSLVHGRLAAERQGQLVDLPS